MRQTHGMDADHFDKVAFAVNAEGGVRLRVRRCECMIITFAMILLHGIAIRQTVPGQNRLQNS